MSKSIFAVVFLFCASILAFAQDPSPSPTPDILQANKLGLNIMSPSARMHIKAGYLATETATELMIKFSPPSGLGDFAVELNTTLEGDDPPDDKVCYGWNIDGSKEGEPRMRLCMERAFGHGDEANYEIYYEVFPKDGGSYRPWMLNVNRKTGAPYFVQSGVSNEIYAGANVLKLNTSELLLDAPVRLQSDNVAFETSSNGGNVATQIRFLPHPTNSAQTWMLFGSTSNGASLAQSMQGFQIYRGGTSLQPGEFHAYRYYGYGSSWGSALTMIGDRVGLAAGRSVSFSTTTAPDGAADVELRRTAASTIEALNPVTGLGATFKAGSLDVPNTGSYKIGGTKILGVQCGSVANSTGGTDDTRAINALLGCLRSHGLLAP